MAEVVARVRWFAKGAVRGTGGTRTTLFEDRAGPRAGSDRWTFAPEKPASSTYLRDGLLILGVVAAGLLLGRRSTRGGAPLSLSSDAGETHTYTTDRAAPEPARISDPPSGPSGGPADGPGGGTSALRRPAPQEAVSPPTIPFSAEPPSPEDPAVRPAEDLDRAPAVGVPTGLSASTPSGEAAATVEEPLAPQEAEQPPAEEAPSIVEELPPPPQASEVQLPPPPQASDVELPPATQTSNVELSPSPSTPDVAEELPPTPPAEETPGILDELPPPPEVAEVELPPPPPAPENVLDELPPPPVAEEQNVSDVTAPPPVESVADAPRETEPRSRRRVTATPAARRLTRELGVDLFEVEGTGKNGKITVDDVRRRSEQTRS